MGTLKQHLDEYIESLDDEGRKSLLNFLVGYDSQAMVTAIDWHKKERGTKYYDD